MTFLERMRVPVAMQSTGSYLFDKVAHTALITLALFLGGVPLVLASIVATLGYLLIGKAVWLYGAWRRAQDWTFGASSGDVLILSRPGYTIGTGSAANFTTDANGQRTLVPPRFLSEGNEPVRLVPELKDLVFDGLLSALVVLLALAPAVGPRIAVALVVWATVLVGLSLAGWGRPG